MKIIKLLVFCIVYAGGVHHYVHAKDSVNVDSKNDVEFENKLDKKHQNFIPQYIKAPQLVYPKNLERFANGGKVVLRVRASTNGTVQHVRVEQSAHPDLEQVAVGAILNSRLQPLPEDMTFQQELNFTGIPQGRSVSDAAPFIMPKASKSLPEYLQYDQAPQMLIVAPVIYPMDLLEQNKKGSAKVYIVINPEGQVVESEVISATKPTFGLAAQASLASWKFSPAYKDHQPSWAVITKEYNFNHYDRDTELSHTAKEILNLITKKKDHFTPASQLDYMPKALYRPLPRFTAETIKKSSSDQVLLEFYVDQKGFVQLPRIISSQQDFVAWLILTEVKRWQFQPPMLKGKPVITKLQLPIQLNS